MKRYLPGLLLPLLLSACPLHAAVVCGDINGDGKVDIKDATVELQLAVGLAAPTSDQLAVGDLNQDKTINVQDATKLLLGAVALLTLDNLCAGTPSAGPTLSTVVGDPNAMANGSLTSARFQLPNSVAFDSKGDLIVADLNNHAIRMITPDGTVSTLVGNGVAGYQDGPASQALLGDVTFVKVGPDGTIYFSDSSNLRIRALSADRSTVSTLAGGYSVDQNGKPATDPNGLPLPGHRDGKGADAQFMYPYGLAVDANSNVYVADPDDNTIRKVAPDGTVTTAAGNQQSDFADSADPLAAAFRSPTGVAFDDKGNLYISDWGNELIRILAPMTGVTTLAGNPNVENGYPVPGYSDGPGDTAQFGSPEGLAFANNTLYVAEWDNYTSGVTNQTFTSSRIRAVAQDGTVSTIAGNDQFGEMDGKGTAATFRGPTDVAAMPDGTLFVADTGNDSIRKIAPDGTVTTYAGKPAAGFQDGPAAQAQLLLPQFLSTDGKGTFYIGDYGNNRIRTFTVDKSGQAGPVTTVVGGDLADATMDPKANFQDGPVAAAKVSGPTSAAVGPDGTLYFTDRENNAIRMIKGGVVTTFAGTGDAGFQDGPGNQAKFNRPRYLQFGPDGNLYVSDTYNHRIRKITPDGTVSTVAGGGAGGDAGADFKDGAAADARFAFPQGLAIAANGTIYVADIGNQRIRKIDPMGSVTTLAGSPPLDQNNQPLGGYMDGPGSQAQFNNPGAIVLLSDGSLLVSDRQNNRIRKIASDGTVSTVAGISDSGFWDGPVSIARMDGPFGLAFDTDGSLLIAEENNHRVRRLRF